MKLKKMIQLCLLLLIIGSTQTIAQTLVLHHANGSTTDVELYTQPLVTFENDKVLVKSSVLNMEFEKADVLRFTYKGSSQGIAAPHGDADMSRDGDRLVFRGVKPSDQVAVYTANGIRVPVRLQRSDNDATLSLSQIPTGVYLLSVNGRTSKFTRP